jgi:hypothetical protein
LYELKVPEPATVPAVNVIGAPVHKKEVEADILVTTGAEITLAEVVYTVVGLQPAFPEPSLTVNE